MDAMELIAAPDAKSRLSELLERASRGETFVITLHGRRVARLVPEGDFDRQKALAAVKKIRSMRKRRGVSLKDIRASIHEGHDPQ